MLSHDQLTIEIYGTIAIRAICYVLPALAFLGFDLLFPQLSKNIKARGQRQLPGQLNQRKLINAVGVALGNVALAILVQALLEYVVTNVFHLRSLVKVTSVVPLPWTIVTDLLKGLAIRGLASYAVHRYLQHTYDTPLKAWHHEWQHSITYPFSLIAAYDHPANYLLREWLPTFLPAYLFRWHVLTWDAFIVIVSLEELFIYSGYAVLPSTILLAGMARRTDAHFDAVRKGSDVGNFGHLGLLDFVLGTTCKREDDILDDFRSEAEKHAIQDRIESAVQAALREAKDPSSAKENGKVNARRPKSSSSKAQVKAQSDEGEQEESEAKGARRGGRRKLQMFGS